MIDNKRIETAQAAVNRHRAEIDLPPAKDFVTIEFHNGFVTVPTDYFNRLSQAKKKKLMKF